MLYWWSLFGKEIPISCLFTQWKWTYILDFGPWKWSALNMGYMDKQPSRMQGQLHFSKSGGAGNSFLSRSKIFKFVFVGLPGGAGSRALAPIHLTLKVCWGGGLFNVRHAIHLIHAKHAFQTKFAVTVVHVPRTQFRSHPYHVWGVFTQPPQWVSCPPLTTNTLLLYVVEMHC